MLASILIRSILRSWSELFELYRSLLRAAWLAGGCFTRTLLGPVAVRCLGCCRVLPAAVAAAAAALEPAVDVAAQRAGTYSTTWRCGRCGRWRAERPCSWRDESCSHAW